LLMDILLGLMLLDGTALLFPKLGAIEIERASGIISRIYFSWQGQRARPTKEGRGRIHGDIVITVREGHAAL